VRGEEAEADALTAYDTAYRGAFDRYLRFLYFFYDNNVEADSYFWQARSILAYAPEDLEARTAFVRLISGRADWNSMPDLVSREQDRWNDAIRRGRSAAMPGADLLRAATTKRILREV
jgi:hypothetical protein